LVHRPDEPVSTAGEGFYITRLIRGIAESLAQLVDGRVQSLLKIHKCRARPQVLLQVFTADDLAVPFHQNRENPQRLPLQAYPRAMLVEVA
jgi:hypothetical protein